MAAEPQRFAALFSQPSVDAMYKLSPTDFERFVAYVLRRAGYEVKEVGVHFLRGVDLEMRVAGKPRIVGGVECKRLAVGQNVAAPVVRGIRGAPAVEEPGSKPYVVTTSDFNPAAKSMAEVGERKVYLINGVQLVRFIKYIQGSRHDDDDSRTAVSPEYFAGSQSVRSRSAGGTTILTIANNKGGVGKTTTAYYLGVALAHRGKRVLLIDLDAQANLTERCFGDNPGVDDGDHEHRPNIVQYFANQRALAELVVPTKIARLSIIPSDPFLRLRDYGGNGRPDIELRFVRDVQNLCMQPPAILGAAPDWIIIDTPPAMSVFTRAGLATAQYILAPVRPRPASVRGTMNMVQTLQTMNVLMGTPARLLGAVVTHWDGLAYSSNFLVQVLELVMKGEESTVLPTHIPIDNQLELHEPGARNRGAVAYEQLAEEVLNHVEHGDA